jgi:excisionase family DNA binding protein
MSPLHSIEESARLLGISAWTVRAYIRVGRLHPVRIGRRILLSEPEIQRFIRESFVGPQPTSNLV